MRDRSTGVKVGGARLLLHNPARRCWKPDVEDLFERARPRRLLRANPGCPCTTLLMGSLSKWPRCLSPRTSKPGSTAQP